MDYSKSQMVQKYKIYNKSLNTKIYKHLNPKIYKHLNTKIYINNLYEKVI